MSDRSVKNPCVSVCKFADSGVCRGCFRTKEEVRGWKKMSDAEKIRVNLRVRPLIAGGGKAGKTVRKTDGAKRARKVEKKIRTLEKRLATLRGEKEVLAGRQG